MAKLTHLVFPCILAGSTKISGPKPENTGFGISLPDQSMENNTIDYPANTKDPSDESQRGSSMDSSASEEVLEV